MTPYSRCITLSSPVTHNGNNRKSIQVKCVDLLCWQRLREWTFRMAGGRTVPFKNGDAVKRTRRYDTCCEERQLYTVTITLNPLLFHCSICFVSLRHIMQSVRSCLPLRTRVCASTRAVLGGSVHAHTVRNITRIARPTPLLAGSPFNAAGK